MSQSHRLSQSNTVAHKFQSETSHPRSVDLAYEMQGTSLESRGGTMMEPAYAAQEDTLVRLFEPDLITPDQHRDRICPELTDRPEIRLMLAVMEDAVATVQRYAMEPTRRNQKLFEDAQEWIESTDTSWPYSFENVCTALRFEPETLRRGLRAWRDERVSGKAQSYRFPFRRVNGKRHSITVRDRGVRKRA